jgi:adenylylsulfate kinase-like enzyme
MNYDSQASLNPGVIWITGITASGKTTLGTMLSNFLKSNQDTPVNFFDGEEVRKVLEKEYGYSSEDRAEVVREL